ncbi:retention module-containing protein [Enterovibrio sp. ZSDZ42]|uniref:Retention module-containing protein n=1 Tax=Enterovibrio gelatinilyticus TaxID=2899819 RepID=A0ABT5R626_9GAMM|nr:retention module-containing protein [Enterovibrio sp. ZSDZ42]MDD1795729.1 retention module-containing protein [Enterovibrio sp. ZSDZ42]
MIGHEFDTALNIDSVKGQAFLVSNASGIVPAQPGMLIAPNQVLLTNDSSSVVASFNGQKYYVDSRCASCLIPLSDSDAQLATSPIGVRFNPDELTIGDNLNLDIADLQQLILDGVDPTDLFEEPAAGESVGSSNAGFVVVDYLYASSLTEAGFDTTGPLASDTDEVNFLGGDNDQNSGSNTDGTTPVVPPVVDVDALGGQRLSLEVTEGDLDPDTYGVSQTESLSIAGGSERLLPGSLQIAPSDLAAFEAELATLTSNGEAVSFTRQTSVDSNGVGTFTLVGTVNGDVVVTLTITATQDGNGLSVTATLTQSGPLDHLESTGSYVAVNGDSISINMPLQVADTGGDLMQSPAVVTLVSNDGQDTVLKEGSLDVVEPQTDPSETKVGNTSDGIDLGSDEIGSISFDVMAAESAFAGITSHGMPTTVDTSVEGVITVYSDNNGVPEKVLEITFSPSGASDDPTFTVTQYQPIDQHQASDGDSDDEKSSFTLPYTATDADGDVSNISSVTFNIIDGTPALGGERLDAFGAPTDVIELEENQTQNQYDASAPENTQTGTINVGAASDRLVPDTFSIDDGNNNATLISELKLLSNNQNEFVDSVTITPSTDGAGNAVLTILASINGEPAIRIVLTSEQAADGLGMDVDAAFTQFQALIHPTETADQIDGSFVSADGEKINIKLPIQVEDTDGDKLVDPTDTNVEAPLLVTFTVNDDDSTTFGLVTTDPIYVEESSIDDGTGISQGSKSSGTLNIDATNDSGDPNTLDADSDLGDDVSNFFFKSDYVVYDNGQPVLASGYDVFLEQRPETAAYPKHYYGVADDGSGNNRDVMHVVLNADGTFTFELLSALDHEPGDGQNSLTFSINAFTVDADGDESNNIRVPITVQDDVPTTQGSITLAVDDSSTEDTTVTVDVFDITDPSHPADNESLQGADGAHITRIHNGVEWVDVSTTRPSTITLYSAVSPNGEIGTMRIDPRNEPVGEITFTFAANVVNPSAVLNQAIQYEVTDNDGDKAEGEISLTLNDQTPIITIAPAKGGVIEGKEDQGQIDTNTENAGIDASEGIAINVRVNIGDNDVGEAYEDNGILVLDGEVTLMTKDPSGDIGGKFYFNGTEILPDGDGNIVFSGNMFQASGTTAPILFDLSGVTFIPDADYSSYDDTDLIQFDVELEVTGHDPVMTSSPVEIKVSAIADTPTITLIGDAADGVFEMKEDFDPYAINVSDPLNFTLGDLLSSDLQDTDGSETLQLEFTLSPDMGELRGGGINLVNGVWVLEDPSRLDKVRFIPDEGFSGDVTLGIKAISTESDPVDLVAEKTAETTSSIILRVEPVSDEARVVVRPVVGNEDAGNPNSDIAEGNAISLANAISITSLGNDTDGSEVFYVRIFDLPDGATLQLNDGGVITPVTETDRVAIDDLAKLELIPPLHSNENFTLKVEGIVVDSATNSPDDERILPVQSFNVNIAGVADTPVFEVENEGTDPGQWQYDADTGVVTTTVPEDGIEGDGLVAIDFTVSSGESALSPTDTSESMTLVVSNIPDGVAFVVKNADGSLTDVELAFAGWATDGAGMSIPTYSVDLPTFATSNVFIKLPPNSTEDVRINAKLVATENDGDEKAIETVIEVVVGPPVIDATDYGTSTSFGREDQWITIDWKPVLSLSPGSGNDGDDVIEKAVGVTISGFSSTDSVQLVRGPDVIPLTLDGDKVTLTEAQIAQGYLFQVKRGPHSDLDLTLETTVTVRQDDLEGQTSTEKEITGSIEVDIAASVETEEGRIQLVQDGVSVSEITTDSDGRIDLDEGVIFAHPDDSSDESLIRIVITGLEAGFYVDNAVTDGNGGWIINDPNDFSIIAPPNSSGSTTFTISAMAVDAGDAGENDTSLLAPVSSEEITLNYVNNNTIEHEAQQVVVPTTPVVIEGKEDNAISLDALGDAVTYPSNSSGDVAFDVITVVINPSDLPPLTVVSGARIHVDNRSYVFEVPARQGDGNPYPNGLDLSGLSITPPDDFAGVLMVPVTFVSVDTRSGDTETSVVSVQLNVTPLVDLPPPDGEAQPSDNSTAFSFQLTAKETQGLNGDRQPLDTGETEQIVEDEALEDGIAILALTANFADKDQTNGEETISGATLTVPAGVGVFILPDGTESTTLVVDASQIDNIKFKPAPDFSGEVEISATVTITDTASTGTDSRTVDTTINFDVIAVNDEVTFTQNGIALEDDDVVAITADEDPTEGISLADLGFSFNDIDNSESLASIVVENVPLGFTLSSPAVNGSQGQWIIPASAIIDNASLSQIKVEPAANFSGTVEFTVTVYTQEESLDTPTGFSQTVSLTVDPVADGANASVKATASGVEDNDIHLELEIKAKDDRDSVNESGQPTGVNVTENEAETLLITISGVPDGGKIVLPDGVTGSVTPEISNGGDVVVTVDSSRLDDLTFTPPQDANGTFVLDLAIQTVDNGDVSVDVVNKQITVEVSAVNDKPVNVIADSYDAEEDTILTITDLQVQDVDAREGASIVYVELKVEDGNTLDLVGDSTGITVSGDGSNVLTLEGDIDAINTLLAGGVNYQFSENASGEDSLTMTTRDRGNFGSGGQKFDRDVVTIVVAPKSDLPELTYASQLASIRASTGVLVPMLGLMATLVDPIENEFSLTFSGLGTEGELVDSAGDPVGTNDGSGNWTLSQTELASLNLADLNLRFTAQPVGDVTVTALSDVGDGDPQDASLTINVNVVDTATTPVLNDADNTNDDLVVDGNQATQVHGGAGEDILAGGLGEDILIGGEGDDQMWGGNLNGTGDGEADTFAWKSGDFGTPGNLASDVIKDFEAGVDVIDISEAFIANGLFTFTDLANRLDIQTVGSDTQIQIFNENSEPLQSILIEGNTLNELLGTDATGLTQDEILESMLMTGQLVVFDPSNTQFGTEDDDVLTADDDGERMYAGDGDDTLTGGLGNDILVGGAGDDTLTGGAGDDIYAWSALDVEAGELATDTLTDFDVGDTVTGDKLDISAILPEAIGSGSTIGELLDYIRPEVTSDGLTLHVSQTAGGMEVQDIALDNTVLADLGLDMSATGTDILNQLIQHQALKLD